MPNFRANLSGVKDYSAGVVFEADDQAQADERGDLLALYEEHVGGVADWENSLKDVYEVSVVDVEEVEDDEEPEQIDWDELRRELAERGVEVGQEAEPTPAATQLESDDAALRARGFRPHHAIDAGDFCYHDYRRDADGASVLVVADSEGRTRVFRELEIKEVREL